MTGNVAERSATRPLGATARPVRAAGLVAIAGLVVIAAAAALLLGGPGRQVVTGVVVDVEASSLTDVQGFAILTGDGRTVTFRIGTLENASTFPPGHLAEHRVSLAQVRVTYVVADGANAAIRLEDAP